ncbi:MAG: entericidin A/B family lipoprotein [Akkermansia sp.]
MKLGILLLSVVTSLSIVSCNTFSGMGKDVEALGSNIDKAAVKTKGALEEN